MEIKAIKGKRRREMCENINVKEKKKEEGERDLFLFAGKMPNAPAHILKPVIAFTAIPCCYHLHYVRTYVATINLFTAPSPG